MDSRVILPLESLDEFFQLLKLTPEEKRTAFLITYKDVLGKYIQSVDDIFNLFNNGGRLLKTKIIKNHATMLCGAFKTMEDLLAFKPRDKDYDFYKLTEDRASPFTQHLISLFTQPDDVLLFIEKERDMSRRLFEHHMPCAKALTLSKDRFGRLCMANFDFAQRAANETAESLTKIEFTDIKNIFRLAEVDLDLMRIHKDSEVYSSWSSTSRKEKSLLLSKFEHLLSSEDSQAAITDLTQRENFIRLYKINRSFAVALLAHTDLITILFDNKMTLDNLTLFVREDVTMVEEIQERYPAQVAALFQSTNDVRQLGYDWIIEYLPEEQLKTIAALFTSSTILDDWLWLAEEVAKHNHRDPKQRSLTKLAAAALGEYPFHRKDNKLDRRNTFKTLFSNVQNLMQLTQTWPGFASKVINQLREAETEYSNDEVKDVVGASTASKTRTPPFNPVSLFSDPETFWQFLQAGGTGCLFEDFALDVCARYPEHITFIYARSNRFANLDADFGARLLSPPGWGSSDRWSKVIELLEASDNNSDVLEKFPMVLNYWRITSEPKRLISFAKTADDLVALAKSHLFKLRETESDDSNTEFENKKLEDFIQTPACQIPDILRSSATPSAALVRLAKAHPFLVRTLIEHQTKRMLPTLDVRTFMQLDFYHSYPFADRSPDAIAALFVASTVELKDLMQVLLNAEFHHSYYAWMHRPFCEVFKRQPDAFARIFVAGELKDRIDTLLKYPIFTDILFEHAPEVMAQAFRGADFVELLKIAPTSAVMLLHKLKDNLERLIPTATDLAAVNKENTMLMRQFTFQHPVEAAVHIDVLSMTPTSAFAPLPSIVGNKNLFLAPSSKPTQAVDMHADVGVEEMVASAFGQGTNTVRKLL